MSKIALFAIVFASLAPSISHALAAQSGTNSFTQQVCTSNGKKITIQVVTTQGKQLAVEIGVKPSNENAPKSISHHFEHCPFCGNAAASVALPSVQQPFFGILKPLSKPQTADLTELKSQFFSLTPPAQAPPRIL